MKAISCFEGYRGFYEVHEECIIVHVYKSGVDYDRCFGFSLNKEWEQYVEYEFRENVSAYISNKPRIYKDLINRFEKGRRINTEESPVRELKL